jgi:hypothetical protein
MEKPLSQGKKLGTVSAERYTRDRYWNNKATKSLKGDLARLTKKGALGSYKSVKGRYQDKEKAPGDIDTEKTFLVRQGNDKKAKHFDRILSALGKRYGQQTTMHIHPNKEAEYHWPSDKKKVDKIGKVVYNKPLVANKDDGAGDTSFGKNRTFTTRK